jgi:hypothetical protein
MRGAFLIFVLFAATLAAANLKLYMTDGDYQLVREYKVEGDIVKFYSIDRSEWEEVPASIVDLKRTEAESAATKQVVDRQTKMADEEVAAARAEREELAKIPKDSGVYRIENGALRTFPVADFTVHTPKGNTALRVLTPIPIVAGKATVELAGEHSPNVVHEDRPEFFFQLDKEESFGIIKLSHAKGIRIAEHVEIMPISKEMAEDRDSVKVFSKQLPGDNFYKVWPEETLPAGEYALIEFVDGQVDLRMWDFRIE